MRRTILACAGVLLSVVALASDSPKEYDGATEVVGIEGTWRETGFEANGQKIKLNFEVVKTYRSGTFTIVSPSPSAGSYRIDQSRNPPQLEWLPSSGAHKGKTIKWIYQIDGDTLKIACLANEYEKRPPQGFDDKDLYVYTYKRVK
jgi:uncharacterized protein (TIGR03067 family)